MYKTKSDLTKAFYMTHHPITGPQGLSAVGRQFPAKDNMTFIFVGR
jgi:hypothetical protein